MARQPDLKVVVQLSVPDRTLLRRIANSLDPVLEPKSGPRRLSEPTSGSYVSALLGQALGGADARIALTADDVAELSSTVEKGVTPQPVWSEPVNGVQYLNSWVGCSNGEHLDAGYTELALRYGNARRVEPSVLERLIEQGGME